jgi:DsbC/DsbD-like thiol-disulfide interchange protein
MALPAGDAKGSGGCGQRHGQVHDEHSITTAPLVRSRRRRNPGWKTYWIGPTENGPP